MFTCKEVPCVRNQQCGDRVLCKLS